MTKEKGSEGCGQQALQSPRIHPDTNNPVLKWLGKGDVFTQPLLGPRVSDQISSSWEYLNAVFSCK
jgi:hypothetical protein